MTLEDFILKAIDLLVLAVDITAYYLKSTERGYLHGLRKLAYRHGIAFSGAACGVSMVQADAANRTESLKQIKKWVDVTDDLGASHLRIFAGKLPSGSSLKDAIDWVVEMMKAACDYSGERGIMLGLEDHDGVTQSADRCLEIMQRVNSPFAGINLDITNFIDTPTQDAYAQIAVCLPYATNTTSATVSLMAHRWIWTAYGRCLRAPATRAICQPSMKLVCLIAFQPLRGFQNWFHQIRELLQQIFNRINDPSYPTRSISSSG